MVGIILIPWILLENKSFKNEIAFSFPTSCKVKHSAIVRKKLLKASATFSGPFAFSLFIRIMVKCIFPVSFFTMFHDVLFFIRFCYMSTVMLLFSLFCNFIKDYTYSTSCRMLLLLELELEFIYITYIRYSTSQGCGTCYSMNMNT
jgi:hypothetical protein